MEQPSYYAIIPAIVRYNKSLKANEKLLYGEITALANKRGYCNASNAYFAELYDTTPETVSRWISNLVKQGCLKREEITDGKQIIERRLFVCEMGLGIDEKINTPMTKKSRGIDENIKGGIDENVKGNNTRNNNINTPYIPQEKTDCANALVSANAETCVSDFEEKKSGKGKKSENVPYDEIMKAYNEELGDIMPKATVLNDERKRAIKRRWNEYLNSIRPDGQVRYQDVESGLKWWRGIFRKARHNPHWCGANDANWTATLSWFLKPANFVKLVEFLPSNRK